MSKLGRILISILLVLVTVQCLSQEADTKLLVAIDGVLFKPFYDTYGRYSVSLEVTLR
jgi:hypothetical protein